MMLVLSLSQKHNHKEAVEIFHVALEFQVHSHPYPVIPASCSASEEAGGRSMWHQEVSRGRGMAWHCRVAAAGLFHP